MLLTTSYFANLRNTNYWDYTLVAISRSVPTWLAQPYEYLKILAPDAQALFTYKNTDDKATFTTEYLFKLESIGVERILDMLKAVSQNKPVMLLCWEGRAAFCHRRLLTNFLGLMDVEQYEMGLPQTIKLYSEPRSLEPYKVFKTDEGKVIRYNKCLISTNHDDADTLVYETQQDIWRLLQ